MFGTSWAILVIGSLIAAAIMAGEDKLLGWIVFSSGFALCVIVRLFARLEAMHAVLLRVLAKK
jgi:hypothetical protein